MYMENEDDMTLRRGPKLTSYVQFIVDVIILALVVVTFVLVMLVLPVSHTGFFCDDSSIKYPYKPDTIDEVVLILCCVFIPLVIILILELLHKFRYIGGYGSIVSFLKFYGFSMLGFFGALVISEVARKTFGRLRPDFWQVCMPMYDTAMCTSKMYISAFTCMANMSVSHMEAAKASNPSNTAVMCFFIATWLAVYFQFRLRNPFSMFIKVALQCAVIAVAYWASMTRLYDNKAHWGDVLTGGVIGVVVAVWVILASNEHLDYNSRIFVIEEADDDDDLRRHQSINTRTTYYGNAPSAGAASSNVQRVTVGETRLNTANTNSAFVYDK